MRKTYDHEFKLKLTQDLLEKKVTTKRIAEEYNISRPTIPNEFQNIFDTENSFAGQGQRITYTVYSKLSMFFKNH